MKHGTKKMYDIFYIGDNSSLKENFPFAKKVDNKDSINPKTTLYWLIEPNTEIIDFEVLEFVPKEYDNQYEHVWKWNSNNYGGIRLLPKKISKGVKEINQVVCKKKFDTLDTTTPKDYFEHHPYATHVWCVDPEYKLTDDINWAPDNFEPTFIHSFHLKGQLEHKYPEKEGGIKLFPNDWKNAETKYHNFLDANVIYPILYVKDANDYSQRDILEDDYVWLIDQEHKTNVKTFDWVPNPFEQDYIHNFKMPYQLTEKYPQEMGGINLVPKVWQSADVKIHPDCPVEDENYDVFYTNKPFDADTFEFYAKRSDTDWFWVIDREYDFNGKLLYVPAEHEQDYIHVFKWGLEHRYDPDITEVWDNRVAGIYLVNKEFDVTKKKLHTDIVPIRYDVYFTDNINDYGTFARKSRTEAFWLVDNEHKLSEVFTWVPPFSEQKYINIFKLPGQLQHKYPLNVTNVSDNRCGGIKLIPKNYNEEDLKYQGALTEVELIEYEKFSTEEEGRLKSKNNWFWVIDNDVDVSQDFDFDFVPDTWDEGKTHVWQKLNPITGKEYDYGGVSLCPKVAQTKGRPKYIRQVCSTQKEYPVYTMTADDVKEGVAEFYKKCANKTDTKMFWVVDYCVQVCESFNFSYYPTQWDIKNVHVWQNEYGDHTDVRLCPTELFLSNDFTEKEIVNNTFEDLKLMPKQASEMPKWNHYWLYENVDESLKQQLLDIAKEDNNAYFWTIDGNVDKTNFTGKYKPAVENADKLHVWQKINPRTGKVHAYGGVRLWPNPFLDVFKTSYSSDDIKYSKTSKGKLQYVKDALCTSKPYDIVFLSYNEPGSTTAYERLTARFDAYHVKDVKGIFNAHKTASYRVSSDMFWVVDADADISEDFDFSYIPDVYDEEVVHVWASKNPVTGEEYGYGGVKLFNTNQVRSATTWGLDFTTGLSKRFKAMPQISCTTRFNTDAYSTWRSAFRECVKLTLSDDVDSDTRLNSWLNPQIYADYVDDAIRGAKEGKAFALDNKNNLTELNKINDYDWLRDRYNKT